jgi:hypothetical protein
VVSGDDPGRPGMGALTEEAGPPKHATAAGLKPYASRVAPRCLDIANSDRGRDEAEHIEARSKTTTENWRRAAATAAESLTGEL